MESIADFFLIPLSGSADHALEPAHALHGRLMVVTWCVLLPLGVLIARFFKVTLKQKWPRQLDDRRWWAAHLVLQIAGIVVMLTALYLVFDAEFENGRIKLFHELTGWTIVVFALSQGVGGIFRGSRGERPANGAFDEDTLQTFTGDHYNMTPRRRLFESCHKVIGYLCLLLSMINIYAGLYIADAYRWMFLAITLWWLVLIYLFVSLQKQGRCIDTYQAIYGPDRKLPGNQQKPIGWGIKRYEDGEWPPYKTMRN